MGADQMCLQTNLFVFLESVDYTLQIATQFIFSRRKIAFTKITPIARTQ